jgi:hypothetical protein
MMAEVEMKRTTQKIGLRSRQSLALKNGSVRLLSPALVEVIDQPVTQTSRFVIDHYGQDEPPLLPCNLLYHYHLKTYSTWYCRHCPPSRLFVSGEKRTVCRANGYHNGTTNFTVDGGMGWAKSLGGRVTSQTATSGLFAKQKNGGSKKSKESPSLPEARVKARLLRLSRQGHL